ncbi:hypothetical protein Tsubulata_023418, partial [Turnera subulata]
EFRAMLFNNKHLVSRPSSESDGPGPLRPHRLHTNNHNNNNNTTTHHWIGEGQFVAPQCPHRFDSSSSSIAGHRNRSFGRQNPSASSMDRRHFRRVPCSWSATRQLQAIGNNPVAPQRERGDCHRKGCGGGVHFSVPKQLPWAASIKGAGRK